MLLKTFKPQTESPIQLFLARDTLEKDSQGVGYDLALIPCEAARFSCIVPFAICRLVKDDYIDLPARSFE